MIAKRFFVLFVLLLVASVAQAAQLAPAIIFDIGGKFDQSLNQNMIEGAEGIKTETGIDYQEIEITTAEQREQTLRSVGRSGANPIVSIGFAQALPLEAVAKEFPGRALY